MEKMTREEIDRREAALRGRLERLVEMDIQISRLETAADEVMPDGEPKARARGLLAELREMMEQQEDAAERDLQTFRAERGLAPDD